jgi:muconolactone delta-isomerase
MDFLVHFEINVPEGTPETDVTARQDAESVVAAKLVDQGHLVRRWKRRVAPGESRPIGLYRAESEGELDGPAARAAALRLDARRGYPAGAPSE